MAGYVCGATVLPSLSYTFSLRLQISGQDLVASVPTQLAGSDPASAAMHLIPSLGSEAEARRLIKTGRLRIGPSRARAQRGLLKAAAAFQAAGATRARKRCSSAPSCVASACPPSLAIGGA